MKKVLMLVVALLGLAIIQQLKAQVPPNIVIQKGGIKPIVKRTTILDRRLQISPQIPSTTNVTKPTRVKNFAPVTDVFDNVNITRKIKINSNVVDNMKNDTVAKSTASGQQGFDCTTSSLIVTANSSSFMNVNQTGEGLYPGAIYNYADFFRGNFQKAVGIGKRTPMKIFTNNLINTNSPVTALVNDPSPSNISASIASIVQGFSTTSTSATAMTQYTSQNNKASMMIGASLGGSYAGVSANVSFLHENVREHVFLTIDIKIPMYDVTAEMPTNGYFTDAALESTPDMVVVSNVTYGSRILANVDIDLSKTSDSAAAKIGYKGGTFSVDAAFNFALQSNSNAIRINTYIVGTAPGVLTNPTSVTELLNEVNNVLKSVNYQTARPIQYELSDIDGNRIAIESATDKFQITTCAPKNYNFILDRANLYIATNGDGKEQADGPAQSIGCATIELYNLSKNKIATVGCDRTAQTLGPNYENSLLMNLLGTEDDKNQKSFTQTGSGSVNKLQIKFNPNNHGIMGFDTWGIDGITLELIFKDKETGLTMPQRITWGITTLGSGGNKLGLTLGIDRQALELDFDKGFIQSGFVTNRNSFPPL